MFIVCSNKILNHVLLSGEDNENLEKTIGLISKKNNFARAAHFFMHISLPLFKFCTTTTCNFQKRPSYTFYGEMSYLLLFTFFHSLIFTLVAARISHFLIAAKKVSCCSSNK